MNETAYVKTWQRLFKESPEGCRLLLDALGVDLPDWLRSRLSEPLYLEPLGRAPAPDLALYTDDELLAILEFKSLNAHVNATRFSALLGKEGGTDSVAKMIRDAYPRLGDPAFANEIHANVDACSCVWSQPASSGNHHPGMHQGDAYRLFLPGVDVDRAPRDRSAIGYIFVAPSERSADRWRDGLVSAEAWSIVRLQRIVARMRPHALVNKHISDWVEATDAFVGLQAPEPPT